MRAYYKLPLRLRSLFRKQQAERDLDDEMQFHLEYQIEEYVAQGMDREEARCKAMRALDGFHKIKEECREMRSVSLIDNFVRDLHIGLRMLRRTPGFAFLAILCLTLGIGANTAVFSWIEGVLLRPFPAVAHQERLMAVAGFSRGLTGSRTDVSWPDFEDFQRSCRLFDAFIVDKITGTTFSVGDRAERVTGSIVSANYFDALGVHSILGRGFEPAENYGRSAHPVAVISYRLWKARFGGDPEIIGKTQMLSGQQHTIVGVAPAGFDGTFVGWAMQFWVPLSMQERFDPPGYKLEDRSARWIEGFVRLKPGVTPAQAQAEISSVAQRLEKEYPATNRGQEVRLYPLWQTPFNNAGALLPTLEIAFAVVFFVLLIACANVSNLLLIRAFGRRREITIRLALGAGRGRLLRQLLTEGLILAALASTGGLVLAHWCRNLLALLLPQRGGLTMNLPGEIDWRVLVLSVGVSVLATVMFGLVPAAHTGKLDLAAALKAETGGVVAGRQKALWQSSLVVIQVSLSFVLLVGAGLLLQSLRELQNVSPGFSTNGAFATWVDLVSAGYSPQRIKNFQDDLIDRIQSLPGVQSAAFSRVIPFGYRSYSEAKIATGGYDAAPDEQPTVEFDEVGPGYLATMGVPLLSGREFSRTDDETAPLVAVVNEVMAAKFWPGQNPVGRLFQANGRSIQVVGFAKLSKYRNLTEPSTPFFYVPMRQNASGLGLNIRASMPLSSLVPALVREVHALDANLAPGEVITMQEQVDRTMAVQQAAVRMLIVFGSLALLLATIGVYGVMSYTVSQSTRELGLRMALGANPLNLLQVVMSRGLALMAFGLVLGTAVALILGNLFGLVMYKVSTRDPLAYGGALGMMLFASVAACLLPARRAIRTDPNRALRE